MTVGPYPSCVSALPSRPMMSRESKPAPAANCDLAHLSNGLSDRREGIVSDLTVRAEIVGAYRVTGIDLSAIDERVDLDGVR